jgi:hypothetical protein
MRSTGLTSPKSRFASAPRSPTEPLMRSPGQAKARKELLNQQGEDH